MEDTISLPPEEYTVGWICAIPIELGPAKAMLDKVHARLRKTHRSDNNIYTLGSIGEHNVAIACLPSYGTTNAATAANSMRFTFPNVRFGLMVGIGGGIPGTREDIRLGDIVVSKPNDQGGGVIQYDMGRQEEDGFRRIGSLNKPPQRLISAAIDLEQTAGLRRDIASLVMQARQAKIDEDEDEDNQWLYPGNDKDVLFRPEINHIGGDTCESCLRAIDSIQKREPANRKNQNPRLHHGNIASANVVMKNATVRDALGKTENVICFEMEAAGLMDSFPCLVIRGISDYADSHKNSEWQPYAAAVAAAYAKKLLLLIPPESVVEMTPIGPSTKGPST